MTSSQIVCIVGLFLLIISKTVVAYYGSHGDSVTIDQLTKEQHLSQWSVQSDGSLGNCPYQCWCAYVIPSHRIIIVFCDSRGLTKVPYLPETTTLELFLQNNSISNISCDSFKHLRSLQKLNLASNNISHLLPCVFQSQSGSLLSLDISDNNMIYLDFRLFKNFSRLKTLDLSVNIIAHLANRTFSDLVQLKHLNLSFNFIDTIAPDAFKGLRSLKTLSLRNNRLDNDTSFHRDVFQDLEALEILDVKANSGHLDNAISPLRNLSHLYMELNYRTVVPPLGTGYCQLVNLQVFDVSTVEFMSGGRYKGWSVCSMSTMPGNFFENIQTEMSFELYMSGCMIQNIEDNTFLFLPSLVTLDLSYILLINFWKDKQSWMASLSNTTITFLDLSWTWHSRDSHILDNEVFQDLAKTNLKILSLKGNKVSDVKYFHHFPTTIEKLDVSENIMPLTSLYISYLISDIPGFKLRELHANDQIRLFKKATKQFSQEIPDSNIFRHSSLGYGRAVRAGKTSVRSQLLDRDRMIGSKIQNISTNKTVLLRHLDMDETRFGNIWNAKLKCPLPERNTIVILCLPAELEAMYARSAFHPAQTSVPHIRVLNNTVLRHVDLSNNFLTSWLGPVENVPSLTFLNLSMNNCDNVDVNFFKYMVSLETLILRDNYLGHSFSVYVNGITFSTLTNLKILDVSQNTVQDLSRVAFLQNTKLETLDLSHNRLTEFQPTLSTIQNMSFLDLSDNLLPGLSEQTCQELILLKSTNKMFTVNLHDNPLLFTCKNLPFLDFVISYPHIFFRVDDIKFRYINGTIIFYKDLAEHFPTLARECELFFQRLFIVILIVFIIVVGTVTICAVIYRKRWKLRYLYYIEHRRMHIGRHVVDYVPPVDVFITYDQDDLRWRRFMQQTFLPGLNQRDITYILGETDFPGGDIMTHVTGAVVGTRKTVVLLSVDIFDDDHRELEMKLSIMRELDTRSLKIIPIFVEEVDLALYPREIGIFLRNQWKRCHRYSDSDEFWDGFVDAVREDN